MLSHCFREKYTTLETFGESTILLGHCCIAFHTNILLDTVEELTTFSGCGHIASGIDMHQKILDNQLFCQQIYMISMKRCQIASNTNVKNFRALMIL